jgi:hypothetical protein
MSNNELPAPPQDTAEVISDYPAFAGETQETDSPAEIIIIPEKAAQLSANSLKKSLSKRQEILEELISIADESFLSENNIKITRSQKKSRPGRLYANMATKRPDGSLSGGHKFATNVEIEELLAEARKRKAALALEEQIVSPERQNEQLLALPPPSPKYLYKIPKPPKSRQPELKTPAEALRIFSERIQRSYIDDLIHQPVGLLRHEGLHPRVSEHDYGHTDIHNNEYGQDGLYLDEDPNSPNYGKTITNGLINVRAGFARIYSKQKVKSQPFEYSPSFTKQLLEEAYASGDIVPAAIDPYAQYGADLIRYRIATPEEKAARKQQIEYGPPQEALRRLAEAQGFQGNEVTQLLAEYQDSDQELSQATDPHANHSLVVERGKRDAAENQRLFDEYVRSNQSLLSGDNIDALIAHAAKLGPSASDKSETTAFKVAYHGGTFDYSTFKAPYDLPSGVEGLNGSRTHNGDGGWYSPDGPTTLRKAMERSLELSSSHMEPHEIRSKVDGIIKPIMDAANFAWVTRDYSERKVATMPQNEEGLRQLLDALGDTHGYGANAHSAYRALESARAMVTNQTKHRGNAFERMRAKNKAKEYIQRFYEALRSF